MLPIPNDESGDCYLTTSEVADVLGCTRSFVSVMRGRNNAPPSFKFGKTLLTRKSSIATWLLEQEKRPAEVAE
jgi:predicted DNA-binding transcriptional regulator AlpA